MSLDVWLKKGTKVEVGGRELILMPLPLSKLMAIGHWLEDNTNDVVHELLSTLRKGESIPNPLNWVAKILLRVNVSEVALTMFETPKDPMTGKKLNDKLTVEFFDEYLDAPTAKEIFEKFVKVNQLEELVKNLSSLPIIKKLIEAGTLAFGIPFLNSLQQSTVSAQTKSEGSPSLKSTDMSEPVITEGQARGSSSENQNPLALEEEKEPKKQYLQ